MAKPGKCGKEGGTLQQWVAWSLSQTVQFIYGQIFPTAFSSLNTLDPCRNINSQIAVNKSLLQCGFEYGEISGCCVLGKSTILCASLWGVQYKLPERFYELQVYLRKRMALPLAKIFNSSRTRFQLTIIESELCAWRNRCTWSKYSMKLQRERSNCSACSASVSE